MRADLPTGTVTFLFTDIEGSTRLLHELGAERYAEALAEHRRVLREAFAQRGGVEVDTQGDAFFVAFPTAPGALAAVADANAALAAGPIRVRAGVHTGTPLVGDEGYVGEDVHKAARIAAAAHGGQVVVSAAAAALADGTELRDLGEHRFKDLAAPERVYQLGGRDFPPLRTLSRTNVPVPATSFVGRERELADVAGLLARPDVRLLTLTGPGGTGKTRLAVQAAAAAADAFPDGVWWVPLAAVRNPEFVLPAVAEALGADGDVAASIGDRRLAIVLDNLEQVVDAAPDVATLVARCPQLTAIATSRELLRVAGEHAYAVPPLVEDDAVELFLARARAYRADVADSPAVRELCRRLDELPLALELAAARARVLDPEQLVERLGERLDRLEGGRDADPRQRTLRATIEWSFDLLTEDERRVLARLGVFRGGCELEAAETVCGCDVDVLFSLVDKSLVRRERGGRLWMLETIRQFAVDRLEATDEADGARRAHAELYLALAEQAELRGPAEAEWFARLAVEHDNLRAALDAFNVLGDRDAELRLAAALGGYWSVRALLGEARMFLDRALSGPTSASPAWFEAVHAASFVAYRQGDYGVARELAERQLDAARGAGDGFAELRALSNLANATEGLGDLVQARRLYEASLEVAERLDDTRSVAVNLANLGDLANAGGDYGAGADYAVRAVGTIRRLGERANLGTALATLALAETRLGQVEQASDHVREGLRVAEEVEDASLTAALLVIAAALAADRDPAGSARLLGGVDRIVDDTGYGLEPAERALSDVTQARLVERLGEEAVGAERAAGRRTDRATIRREAAGA